MAPVVRALVTVATALLLSASLSAQAKDDFARAVVDAINADQAPPELRQQAMTAAVDAMAAGLKQWDAAVGKVEAGLKAEAGRAPSDVIARMRMALGAVLLERGRFQAAVAQFQLSIASLPGPPDAYALNGLALDRLGRTAEAVEMYRRAWRRARGNPVNAYRFLRAVRGRPADADVSAATGALLEAVEAAESREGERFFLVTPDLLDDGMSAVPVMPLIAYANAFTQVRRGRYDEAVASFRAALAGSPGTTRLTPADVRPADVNGRAPLIGAAALFARLGREAHVRLDLDAAVAAYEHRVTVVPNDSAAHHDLADVYRSRDDVRAAMVEAAAAALLDPAASRPLVLIGQLHAADGRDEDARRVLERAVTMGPEDAEARYALSRALLRTGRPAEAQRELDVFRQLQAKAMEETRKQFEDNFRQIEETLKRTAPAGDRP